MLANSPGMDNLITPSAVELERLLITMESSLQVHRRHQYFLWSQGVLQSFLPHDVLIFCHGPYAGPDFRSEVLARGNTWEDRALQVDLDRLARLILDAWQGGRAEAARLLARWTDVGHRRTARSAWARARPGARHAGILSR